MERRGYTPVKPGRDYPRRRRAPRAEKYYRELDKVKQDNEIRAASQALHMRKLKQTLEASREEIQVVFNEIREMKTEIKKYETLVSTVEGLRFQLTLATE